MRGIAISASVADAVPAPPAVPTAIGVLTAARVPPVVSTSKAGI